ncbi:MAG: hypothetical protein ACJ788_24625 [Ktedonobacteraceae bacterium]
MQKDMYTDALLKGETTEEITPKDTSEETQPSLGATTAGKYRLEFLLIFIAMSMAILFLDAVLPLNGLWFHTAMLGQLEAWPLLPTHLLFPGWAVSSSIIQSYNPAPPDVTLSWMQVPLLFLAFLLVFLLYLLALRRLPYFINTSIYRYIFYSTTLLGIIYMLVPVVTSPDIFSYISYARMGVIYHLNPLTTLPTAIQADPTYVHIYWNTQPSAYGPGWAAISCTLQWLTLIFGTQTLLPMILALRLLGLVAHLCSTLLIWSIIGRIQHAQKQISPAKRTCTTLAFAWNPLLLFEACVNAHNDAVLLLLILLAIWFLLPGKQTSFASSLLPATVILALATCLKVNVVVLMPFVLIFVWKQAGRLKALRMVGLLALVYTGAIMLLYAPFWQGGAILNIFHTNPTTSRNINTLVEFFSRLYNSLIAASGYPLPPLNDSPAENFTHTLSIGTFVVLYAWLCWRAIRGREALNTLPDLLRWLAGAWFLYCLIGTPWFWPWYMVTFFGLYAIIAGIDIEKVGRLGSLHLPLAIALLAFSMLSIYCFYAWGPHDSFIPGLPAFQWAYLRGLWVWLIPLLALWRFPTRKARRNISQ